MVASRSTVDRVIDAALKHVSVDQLLALTSELCDVPGNQSFRDTVQMLRLAALKAKETIG